VRLKAEPIDSTNVGDDITQADTTGLEYPYPETVRSCCELAAEVEHLGLSILALCKVREVVYTVTNLNRVEHPEKIRDVLPLLLSGSVRAIKHFVTLTKLMADSDESSTLATDGTDAEPADPITNNTKIGV
jgi:hypothetical protein